MIKLDELRSFSREFDMFREGMPLAKEMLAAGLHIPIPLCGREIVWGFGILSQAASYGLEKLMCTNVEGDSIDLLRIALSLEGRCGEYSWEEKERILGFLKKRKIIHRAEEVSPLVNGRGSFVSQTESYIGLSKSLKSMVNKGLLDLKTAVYLEGIPEALCTRFEKTEALLSLSERRQVLVMLFEIWKRDALSDAELLVLAEEVLSSDEPKRIAEALRYRELHFMEETLQTIRSRIGKGIRVDAPPHFEGDAFTVSFSFQTMEEFDKKMLRLGKLKDSGEELFALLR